MFLELNQTELHPLLEFTYQRFGFDFRGYGLSSLKRRIERFLKLFGLRNIHELIHLLENNPTLFDNFRNELTVNTTEMFRDLSFWKVIQQQLIPSIQNKKSIRIWHNGCSTGEEVYSLAILLLEAGLLDKCSIIGTDINTDAIKTAKKGIYKSRYIDIYSNYYREITGSTDSLHKYGSSIDENQFQFNEELRNKIHFDYFDVIQHHKDEVFELILSRNVLIYFTMGLQNQVMNKLYHNLNREGHICFGYKENITWCSTYKYLTEFSSEEKIYERK